MFLLNSVMKYLQFNNDNWLVFVLKMTGISVILHNIISLFLVLISDCNNELFLKKNIGVSISQLQGKVVWITGASSGIGESLALVLAKRGVRLVLSARRKGQLEEVKRKALEVSDGVLTTSDILVLPMDMLVFEKHQSLFEKIIKHFGKLDILVNTAGRSQRAAFMNIEMEVDRELFEYVFAIIHLTRIAVRHFEIHGGRGHLAVTCSGTALQCLPNSSSHIAANCAIKGYFSSLKVEHPELDVTIFCPGPVATNLLNDALTETISKKYKKPSNITEDFRMTADKCAELFAVALVNKLKISWCGHLPFNVLMHFSMKYPGIMHIIFEILGIDTLKAVQNGFQ